MTARFGAILLLTGLSLTSCGGGGQEPSAAGSKSTAASETQSESPAAATEAQVASVIAGYQKDWRKVIKKSADCRWDYVMKDPGSLAEVKRMTCYMEEVTAGTTASSAISELDVLSIPDSLTSLVSETEMVLRAIADVDLEAVCGPVLEEIRDTGKCDKALGARYGAYDQLDRVLDKWSPYL